ncbi:MAG: tetratricopeptide repeat protein [Maricaulaceae bacterium]
MTNNPSYSLAKALGICAAIAIGFAPLSSANEEPTPFDIRHEACLDDISDNPEAAYETALTWQNEGGGYRAQHCIAMALFGLGRTEQAAHRLERIARAPHSVTDRQKADYFFEAANFWLLAEDYDKTIAASSAGLEIRSEHLDLLTTRARGYVGQDNFDAAKKDLDRVLKLSPSRADSYRYRADLHLRKGDHDAALRDINKSLDLDETQVETAVLRGDIREAIRKAEAAEIEKRFEPAAPKRPETDKDNELIIPPFIDGPIDEK